eukprot:7262790-Pyramimonas_sp.AAC.1
MVDGDCDGTDDDADDRDDDIDTDNDGDDDNDDDCAVGGPMFRVSDRRCRRQKLPSRTVLRSGAPARLRAIA